MKKSWLWCLAQISVEVCFAQLYQTKLQIFWTEPVLTAGKTYQPIALGEMDSMSHSPEFCKSGLPCLWNLPYRDSLISILFNLCFSICKWSFLFLVLPAPVWTDKLGTWQYLSKEALMWDAMFNLQGLTGLVAVLIWKMSWVAQEEYQSEGIAWHNIDYTDNVACIHLISKKPTGLFYLLDEESK